MLSSAAFNAFLKTLEEPPRHAIFVLATTEKHKIIPTILSRCQIYDFNRIKVEDGVEYLRYIAGKEGVVADDEALNLIAHKADGGMRDALSMFDKAVSFCGNSLNYKDVAATLNVLDYDTYFSVTDMLREGRYTDALIAFDGVLSRGFSPQVFVAGLNAHLRDLLMAKGPAASLVEFTGALVERYRAQASLCEESFLFSGISLLTEADGRLRQSSNQRLLVELGLMKIAGLGQKKNSEIGDASFATSFALPELVTSRVEPPVAQPAPAPQPAATSQSAPAPQPVPTTAPHSAPTTASQPTPAPASQVTAVGTEPQAERPARRLAMVKSVKSGISINAMMGDDGKRGLEAADEQGAVAVKIDPKSEEKLKAAKSSYVESLMATKPRYGVVFETMTVEGNVVTVTVPSRELGDDILRDSREWMGGLAAHAAVDGFIELKVNVNEKVKAAKPITLEDRLKFLTDKNGALITMIETLGLDSQ